MVDLFIIDLVHAALNEAQAAIDDAQSTGGDQVLIDKAPGSYA